MHDTLISTISNVIYFNFITLGVTLTVGTSREMPRGQNKCVIIHAFLWYKCNHKNIAEININT